MLTIHSYPEFSVIFNPDWETQGSLGSLLSAHLTRGHPAYVCYADIVISTDIVRRLRDSDGDVVLVADASWRSRYENRSAEDMAIAEKLLLQNGAVLKLESTIPVDQAAAEYVGLLKLSPRAVDYVLDLDGERRKELSSGGIGELVEEFLASGLSVRCVETQGGWAELNAPQDLARFVLGTKAETLDRLKTVVRKSKIGDQVQFTVGQWRSGRQSLLKTIRNTFDDGDIIVRSSALTEDGWNSSNAGRYVSRLDVPAQDTSETASAIDAVVDSYDDDNPDHQVLVQAMLTGVQIQGVVLTRTLNYAAPYYTINFDDTGGSTESVTRGSGKSLRTFVVHRSQTTLPDDMDDRLTKVLEATREIESLVGHDSLDIEFAVTRDGSTHLLQLRPMAIDPGVRQTSDEVISDVLETAASHFDSRQAPSPFISGRRTIFGVMPDWNPAEIIGPRPRRLALSLYQHLITDEVWATQRNQYGYRDIRPHPLLATFAGQPYVDVRASFNSFLPSNVPDELGERLVDYYLDYLDEKPHLHDKIEFTVAFTCLTFDFDDRASRLLQAGFTRNEVETLREALLEITRRAPEQLKRHDTMALMQRRFEEVKNADLDPLAKAFILLEDCRRYGTLTFAHMARSGFVAMALLESLERVSATTSDETTAFLRSISTVASRLQQDGKRVAEGNLSFDEFLERYGHLRPGTYEISSPSYADDLHRYLRPLVRTLEDPGEGESKAGGWDTDTERRIEAAIAECGLGWSIGSFERFLREAIEGREYAKFVFSRNVSSALDELARFGDDLAMSRDDLSHVTIDDIFLIHSGLPVPDIRSWLMERSREGDQWWHVTESVELPALLLDREDFYSFERLRSRPNFVTDRRVVAKSVEIEPPGLDIELEDAIVFIPSADPGFDWLFAQPINGLVTMYGGANSHMTIRAAEFGLPAAIGVGEVLYRQLAAARIVELDCANEWIRVVS